MRPCLGGLVTLAVCGALGTSVALARVPAVVEGLRLLEDWQLEDALQLAQQLLAERPDDPEVWLLAARVQHYRGEHGSALALFDAAREEGVDTGYVHALAASSAAYAAHFERLDTEHFSIRYLNKDEIVAAYAAPILEAAYEQVGHGLQLLAAEQGEKIVVEIFPDARGLAGATGLTVKEIATSGTIAVCKFHRLMITSPLATADGYSWADTLAHEFVHLVISKKSHNEIPIWLHEGIAKYYESLWKGGAGEALEPFSEKLLADAVKNRKLITFAQMHPSMAKLPSQEDAALAFAEVFTAIEFFHKRYGADSVPKVLALTGEGVSLQRALRQVFKLDLKGIEAAWSRWLKKRKFRVVPGAAPQKITLAAEERDASKEKPLEEMKDRAVHDFSRLGELLQLRGHHAAAVVEYEKAYNKAGHKYATLTYRLARAYNKTGRDNDAIALLDNTLAVHPSNGDAHLMAGRIRFLRKQYDSAAKHFEAVRLQNPFNPEIHAALAKLYRARGDSSLAQQEERFLALSRKPRPTRSYQLPAPPAGNARLSIVTPRWDAVRVGGGLPVASPLWNHPVEAGQVSLEYYDAAGVQRTRTVEIGVGENKQVLLD